MERVMMPKIEHQIAYVHANEERAPMKKERKKEGEKEENLLNLAACFICACCGVKYPSSGSGSGSAEAPYTGSGSF